jgi:hypothetical protein
MFRPNLGHLQVVSYSLESEELDDKVCYIDDEISHIFTLAFFVAGVCRRLLWVGWQWRNFMYT